MNEWMVHSDTFFSLCPVVCKASFGCSQCHQPFLPLGCVDGSEVKVLLSRDGQVNSSGVRGVNLKHKARRTVKTSSKCHPVLTHRLEWITHTLTLDLTHWDLNASLAAFPGIFLRVIIGQSSSIQHKPTRLPAWKHIILWCHIISTKTSGVAVNPGRRYVAS